jgi:hypothetical protein
MWCGNQACEEALKEKTTATARCIPFEQEKLSDTVRLLWQRSQIYGLLGKSLLEYTIIHAEKLWNEGESLKQYR